MNTFKLRCLRLSSICAIFALSLATTANADVLASWDAWNGAADGVKPSTINADSTLTGISAFAGGDVHPNFPGIGAGAKATFFGSTDGTFGDLGSPAADTTDYDLNFRIIIWPNTGNERRLDFTLTNNTGSDVQLDTFYFDYDPRANASLTVELKHLKLEIGSTGVFTSDLADAHATVIGSFSSLIGGTGEDYNDVSISLSDGLADSVLAPGESVAFRIELPQNAVTTTFAIDNVAITGTPVASEPDDVLASWDVWGDAADGVKPSTINADSTRTGISAFAGGGVHPDFPGIGGGFNASFFGSTDGTFGDLGSPAADATAYVSNFRMNLQPNTSSQAFLDFSVTNNTGADVQLDTLDFDYDPRANASLTVELRHLKLEIGTSGVFTSELDDAHATVIGSFSSATPASGADFYDVSISLLGGLTDSVLADGESAAFRIVLPQNGVTTAFAIDNVAITGSTGSTGLQVGAWSETSIGRVFGISSEWGTSEFMGSVYVPLLPYLYQVNLGWLYQFSGNRPEHYFYAFDLGWIYTDENWDGFYYIYDTGTYGEF